MTTSNSGALAPIQFQFHPHRLRVVLRDGEPWFFAADVCAVLELGNSRMATARLDDDEKGVSSIDTLGGTQQMTLINESGLYSLILGSRKPEAKRFKKWVTSEVLPALRKTGQYALPTPQGCPPQGCPPQGCPPQGLPLPRINRAVERQVLELFVAGLGQSSIARQLGISHGATSHLINGKWRFALGSGESQTPPALIAQVTARHIQLEQARIAERFCASAANLPLQQALDTLGQHWLQLLAPEAGV